MNTEETATGGETPASWDSPGSDEIAAALEKAGVGDAAETPAATTPKADEKPAETPATEETADGGKEEAKPAEETPSPETKASETIVVDGVEYALEDVKKWRREGLFQADYTRKTQALSEDRKAFLREKAEWEASRGQGRDEAAADQPTATVGKTRAQLGAQINRIQELMQDPEMSEAMREALEIQQEMTLGVLRTLHERDVQARQAAAEAAEKRHDADAWNTFESTFNSLCQKHNVTDPVERELLEARILRQEAETADLDDFKASVEKLFEHAHKGLRQRIEKARKEGQEEGRKALTVLPVPPKSGAGNGSAVPVKPEPKAAQTLDDGSAVGEFLDRLSRL